MSRGLFFWLDLFYIKDDIYLSSTLYERIDEPLGSTVPLGLWAPYF